MKTLAFELSTTMGTIAYSADGRVAFTAEFANDRQHSGLFFENLERCLRECGLPELVVVGIGPGAFAGMRIAIATATGLEAACRARLRGIPSVCAINADVDEYCVIGDARRQSFFFAHVSDGECVAGPALYSESELHALLSEIQLPAFSSQPLAAFPMAKLAYPSAARLCELADRGHVKFTEPPLEPLYLRGPHITTPREWLRPFSLNA